MSREYQFDPRQDLPIVEVLIVGSLSPRRIKLVFDTGACATQIDTGVIEEIGYCAADGIGLMSVEGPAGDRADGYLIRPQRLGLLGRQIERPTIGVYDFDNFSQYGIDGLLGWDIIRTLHLEMDGPQGKLTLFN